MARNDGDPFALWGLIPELPLGSALRMAGEINAESVRGEPADKSGLLGVIWELSSLPNLALDLGVRRGISHAAPDWGATLGLTFGV